MQRLAGAFFVLQCDIEGEAAWVGLNSSKMAENRG
jgi:hypothetical protein